MDRLRQAVARLDLLVDWERRDRAAGMRRGLAPALDLVARLGSPERRLRCVHVAGTKGKGTTSSLIATGLARAGLRTGLYTSPHVDRIEERARIDGRDVDGEVLAEALERALAAREAALVEASPAREATWFDLVTAAAFLVLAEARVEWAVIECGLGGRLDSTNVVRGELCVVTNVDLEHTAVLGATRAAIAREKGGILKPGSRLVTGVPPAGRAAHEEDPEEDAGAVLDELARAAGAPLARPSGPEPPTALGRNLRLARLALDELGSLGLRDRADRPVGGWLLDAASVAAARLPGRLDRFSVAGTPVVIDAAHVPSSVALVLAELATFPDLPGPPVVLLALGRDKDAAGVLKALRRHADTVVCTSLTTGPLRPAGELAAAALAQAGFDAEAIADPRAAFERALERAAKGRWLLVIGSFYLAGAVRAALPAGCGIGPSERPC